MRHTGRPVRDGPGQPGAGAVRSVLQVPQCAGHPLRQRRGQETQLGQLRMGKTQGANEHGRPVCLNEFPGHAYMISAQTNRVQQGSRRVIPTCAIDYRFQHRRQLAYELCRRCDAFVSNIKIETEVDRVDRHHPGACQRGLAQAVIEYRLVLARIPPHDQGRIQLLDRGESQSQAGVSRRGVLVTEIRLPQPVVDVPGTDAPHKLLRQVQLFASGRRGNQRADLVRSVPLDDGTQLAGDMFKRGLPVDFLPTPLIPDHGNRQAFGAVQSFITETVTVGQPDLIDVFILCRDHTLDPVVFYMEMDVRACAVM